jgi:hypothetical protein
MLAGLRTLIQMRHKPDRYLLSIRFGAKPARMGEQRPMLGDVFVKHGLPQTA